MRWPQFMRRADASASTPAASDFPAESRFTRVFLAVDTVVIMGLAFSFAFGNGWNTALHLGIHRWIAPLIQPAVDLAVVGLMVGVRYLAKHGWSERQLSKPRRWMRFFGLMTLVMNTGESLVNHHWGRAAWDAIGPILLIAWSELGPWLHGAIYSVQRQLALAARAVEPAPAEAAVQPEATGTAAEEAEAVEDPAPEDEAEEEAEEEPEPGGKSVVPLPEARRQAEVLRMSVRTHVITFSAAGRKPWENVGKAIGASVRQATGRTVTDRRINQIVREEWADLYRKRLVEEPYTSRLPVVSQR